MSGKLVRVADVVWQGELETEDRRRVMVELEVDEKGELNALQVEPDGTKRDVKLVVR